MIVPSNSAAPVPAPPPISTSSLPPTAPAKKISPKQKAAQAKASSKSQWYGALKTFIDSHKNAIGVGYPKVHCRYEKQGKFTVSDTYADSDNNKKLRFQIAWEVEISHGVFYSSNPELSKRNRPDVIFHKIGGISNNFLYTSIKDPDTKSAHVMLNAEQVAYATATNYSKMIEYALNPLPEKANDAEKLARQDIINHLSKNNFVGFVCKNRRGNNVNITKEDSSLLEFSKYRMVPIIFGKETEIAHTKNAWTRTAKILDKKFIQSFSEKANFDLLSEEKKKLYMNRHYYASIMSAKKDGHPILEEYDREIAVQKNKIRLAENALREIKDPKAKGSAYLDQWLEVSKKVRDKSNVTDLNLAIHSAEANKKQIEERYKATFYELLKQAKCPYDAKDKNDEFAPSFSKLNREQINEFAAFLQQELADLLQCHHAYFSFFDGNAHPTQMTRMFDPKLRNVSPLAKEQMTIDKGFFARVGSSIKRGLLDQTGIFVPGIPKFPFVPVKPVYSLFKYLGNMFIPNTLKRAIEERQEIKMAAFDAANKKLNPQVAEHKIDPDWKNIVSDYVDVLAKMEEMEVQMQRLKTINHAIHQLRTEKEGDKPSSFGEGWGSTVGSVLSLNYPGDWDYAEIMMDRRNNKVHYALSHAGADKITETLKSDEAAIQKNRAKYVHAENIQRDKAQPKDLNLDADSGHIEPRP